MTRPQVEQSHMRELKRRYDAQMRMSAIGSFQEKVDSKSVWDYGHCLSGQELKGLEYVQHSGTWVMKERAGWQHSFSENIVAGRTGNQKKKLAGSCMRSIKPGGRTDSRIPSEGLISENPRVIEPREENHSTPYIVGVLKRETTDWKRRKGRFGEESKKGNSQGRSIEPGPKMDSRPGYQRYFCSAVLTGENSKKSTPDSECRDQDFDSHRPAHCSSATDLSISALLMCLIRTLPGRDPATLHLAKGHAFNNSVFVCVGVVTTRDSRSSSNLNKTRLKESIHEARTPGCTYTVLSTFGYIIWKTASGWIDSPFTCKYSPDQVVVLSLSSFRAQNSGEQNILGRKQRKQHEEVCTERDKYYTGPQSMKFPRDSSETRPGVRLMPCENWNLAAASPSTTEQQTVLRFEGLSIEDSDAQPRQLEGKLGLELEGTAKLRR
ncbi:hypothetical protein B0H11DRAFT_2185188 [Mycena galericulata]|nr:hypothetical protein B0H11DRAFT_2185188 [Mycena galericulata]